MFIREPAVKYIDRDSFRSYSEFIEFIGRTCYKSEDKITEGSSIRFIKSILKNKHYSVFEHERLYFFMNNERFKSFISTLRGHELKFINYVQGEEFTTVSMNLRTALEIKDNYLNSKVSDFLTLVKCVYPELFEVKGVGNVTKIEGFTKGYTIDLLMSIFDSRESFIGFIKNIGESDNWKKINYDTHLGYTFKITCDRGVTHELVRHRIASYSQESTRYCNYSNDKFGNEISVINPSTSMFKHSNNSEMFRVWSEACTKAEGYYNQLIKLGASPQEARSVLPNSLKTEIVVTTTKNEWNHMIDLRYKGKSGTPHPQIKEIFKDIVMEFNLRRDL